MNPASGWFTPTRTFMAGMALYFLLHSLIRVSFSDSLELDEAEQWVFAQWLDWGYSSQPPLYTWLLKALFSLLGESIFTTTLLKNLCLYALYVATFGLARRVLGDEQRAILAALSLLLMPPIAWEASRDLTHTVLVACWVPVSLLVVIGLLERPSTRGYLAWGLVTGLGLLSKYNFSLHLAALAVSLLTLPEGRRVLYDRRLLLTLWLAALVYAPQGLWLLEHHAELARGLGKLGVARTPVSLLPGRLIVAIAAYVAPLLMIVALIGGVRLPMSRPDVPNTPVTRLLGRYVAVIGLILLVGTGFIAGGHLRTRWLFPFMVLFPVWLFSRIPPDCLTPLRARCHAGCSGVAASIILLLMLLRIPGAAWTQKPTDINLPFNAVADSLRQAGFHHGVIVAANAHMAGNLRYQFREQALVITPHLGFHLPPRLAGQPLLLFWEAEKQTQMPPALAEFARDRLGVAVNALEPHYVLHPYRYSDGLQSKMAYVIVTAGAS